jgi:HEAT repeat protein
MTAPLKPGTPRFRRPLSVAAGAVLLAVLLLWGGTVAGCSKPSPEPYIDLLQSQQSKQREKAAAKLLLYGDEIVPRLMEEADHELIRVRFEVVRLLGRLRNREAAPALITALEDKSAMVAAVAAWSLGELQVPQAVEPMLRYAGEASKEVRKEVVRALGRCYSDSLEPAIGDSAYRVVFRALKDPTPRVRVNALLGIREFGYRGAAEEVIRMTRDPSAKVRHVAVQALGQLASGRAPRARPVSARTRENVVEALIASLEEPMQTIRTKAIRSLEMMEAQRAAPHLRPLAESGTAEDRREAGRVLENLLELQAQPPGSEEI